MIVDGVELLRMMKNDELRNKDVYVTIYKDYIISNEEKRVKLQFSVDNRIALDEDFEELLSFNDLIEMEFEIVSRKKQDEEIDIEAMEGITKRINFNYDVDKYTDNEINNNFYQITNFINEYMDKQVEIIGALKQLNKKIK